MPLIRLGTVNTPIGNFFNSQIQPENIVVSPSRDQNYRKYFEMRKRYGIGMTEWNNIRKLSELYLRTLFDFLFIFLIVFEQGSGIREFSIVGSQVINIAFAIKEGKSEETRKILLEVFGAEKLIRTKS